MYDRIVVVTRRTRLDELVARFNTVGQARFYIEHAAGGAGNFAEYQEEHDVYERAVALVHRATDVGLPRHVIDRDLVPTYTFGERDVVVAVGQDGLVANVAKYSLERPLIGVNPDPERFDGILLPFLAENCAPAIAAAIEERANIKRVTLAEALLTDGVHYGFNARGDEFGSFDFVVLDVDDADAEANARVEIAEDVEFVESAACEFKHEMIHAE